MPKPIGSLAPVALLVALVVALPAASPAHGAADCAAAPSAQTPPGSHWYYRTDRTTGRKCWYVSSDGRKSRSQVAQDPSTRAQPTEETLATSEPASDRFGSPTRIEQSTTLTWPTTAAGSMQAIAPSLQSAEATKPAEAASAPAEQEPSTRDAQEANEQPEVPAQGAVATTAKRADLMAITPLSLLLLVMGVLAVVGIFLRPVFQTTPTRRPSSRPLKDDLAVVIAAARRAASPVPPPYLPTDYAGGRARSDEGPNSTRTKPRHLLDDVEQALLGVLRDWERPTASVN
jgi:hypothetical protein